MNKGSELADVMKNLYSEHKFKEYYNLWDIAFRWDGEEIRDNPLSSSDFIPNLLEHSELDEPIDLLPKITSVYFHYRQLCLHNRSEVESQFVNLLEYEGYKDIYNVSELVSDRKLLKEAINNFVTLKENSTLDPKLDLFNFLIKYNLSTNKIEGSIDNPNGSYLHMTDRMILRFPEGNLESTLLGLVDQNLGQKAAEYNLITRDPTVNEELKDLHARVVPPKSSNPLIIPKRTPTITGKRKMKRPGLTSINYKQIESFLKIRGQAYNAFELEDVLLSRIERSLTDKYLNMYRSTQQIGPVVATLEIDIEDSRVDIEKRVLQKVKRKLVLIDGFKDYPIKHSMSISTRNKK
jgi:hypothetical protein